MVMAQCVKDYPRVGGEERVFLVADTSGVGLPPRGRGRGTRTLGALDDFGITPAWAGKRWLLMVIARWRKDYPRVGGEEAQLFYYPDV